MRCEPPRIDPDGLYRRRLAARALALVLERAGLGQMALRFNPDDPTQVLPGSQLGEVRFFADTTIPGHRSIAQVFLEGTTARVVIERVRELIRRSHRKEFVASDVGLTASLDVEVDVSGIVEAEGELLRLAPQRTVARRLPRPPPRAISPLAAFRRGG